MTTVESDIEAGRDTDRGPGIDERTSWVILAVLLVGAAALRLYRLGEDSLWDNEILSYLRATAGPGDAYDLIREGTHPPGYSQVILRPWLALGEGEWMQRFPSAVFGVATIVLTAVLGARLAGRRAGLAAAALLTLMPLHLYYSREGRMYALLALVLLAWALSLIRAHERDRWADWGVYTALGAAALYTHYYAGFTVLSVAAVTAAVEVRSGFTDRTRRWLVATALIGVLFLPWLPTFWYQVGNDPVSHLPALDLQGVAELPILFFTAFAGHSAVDTVLVGAALAVLLATGGWTLWTTRNDQSDGGFGAAVVVAAVAGTIVLSIVISALRPLIFVRYFVGILPFVAVLLGAGVARLRLPAMGAFVLLVAVSVVHAVPTVNDTWRPAFAAATDRIEADGADGTVVLLVGPDPTDFRLTGFGFYLDPGFDVVEVTGDVTDPAFGDAIDGLDADVNRVWVLQYQTVSRIDPRTDVTATVFERYDARFFEGFYPISLVRLDREPS